MKYQKKPVVVEAFQITEANRWDNKDWPEWLNRAWNEERGAEGGFWCLNNNSERFFIGAIGGVVEVSYGDWIIRGVKGELYPCKPDIFGEIYREVGDTGTQKFDNEVFIRYQFALEIKIKGLQKLTEDIVRLRRATAILDERDRQDELWGEQDHTLPEWMVILTEEVGELATAICGELFGQGDTCKKNWRTEAVQVAAVALAMLEQFPAWSREGEKP